ncbi:MAG TPA: DNA topoisomerase I [Steroidobacteraceae bacterium]|nr:DNA topoisomerase I [Steroidobacteraceae bacterium]
MALPGAGLIRKSVMAENLVIVESPAKARTIKKYLGKSYEVLASYGHVRDLIPKEGAVDPDAGFAMKYQIIERNARHVEVIARALRRAQSLYLATDPDREGEAIAWHLYEILRARGELAHKQVHRVVFHEITRNAIRQAVESPRDLSHPLVNAQQARRALDYLVGFNLSPLLWKKVRRGLSAGRVQSPALRLICEREAEIAAFKPQEYWTIDAQGEHSEQSFPLRLSEYRGQKVEQFSFPDAARAHEAERTLLTAAAQAGAGAGSDGGAADGGAARGLLRVLQVDRKQRRRNPAPPFTTSTLQQEASRKLGFSAQRTMRLAQQLYEGVDIGEGNVGLITYMRTDSVSLAAEAVQEIREVIARLYGAEAVAEEVRVYRTKSKNAQEAHEAVRPTSAAIVPADIEGKLDPDLFRLYALIWKRAVACQMAHAVFDTVAVDMLAGPDGPARHLLRANGSTLVRPGYIAVYQESRDDAVEEETERMLPAMQAGDAVRLLSITPQQHFTEPPPRYTEASLVKTLEEYGIGRPSTYASIISTLRDRGYVEIDSRRFTATDIGKIVNRFLTEHFHRYVEYGFTAAMEDELDAVSRGEEEWTTPLTKFWKPFIHQVEHTEKHVTREQVAQARELGRDPASGKPVSVRMGRFGPFVQIGTKDDADKPRFAGLRPGQKMDGIGLAEALELFKLPRTLGSLEGGETIIANIGRFGPYLKYGDKYVSLKQDDPYTITLERAVECIRAKQLADANRLIRHFEAEGIRILNGRYGPYITNGEKNARIPKDRDPRSLTLEECQALLAAASARPAGGRFGRRGAGARARTQAPPAAPATAAAPQKAAAPGRAAAPATAATPAMAARPGRAAASASKPRAASTAPVTPRSRSAPPRPHAVHGAASNGRATHAAAKANRSPRKAKKAAGAGKLRGRGARAATARPAPKKVAGA